MFSFDKQKFVPPQDTPQVVQKNLNFKIWSLSIFKNT